MDSCGVIAESIILGASLISKEALVAALSVISNKFDRVQMLNSKTRRRETDLHEFKISSFLAVCLDATKTQKGMFVRV